MRIAFTHNNADCDGFAALVALRRLYPGLEVVLGQRVAPRVQSLLGLHRDIIRPISAADIDFSKVELAVVADVRRRSRLEEYEALFQRHDSTGAPRLIVYDHHGPSDDDLAADECFLAQVGATCTLVSERLRAADIELTPVEATLLSIGIHTDTGSLTYATSTPRDADALTWLMECGAHTRIVERFLRQTLTDAQRAALTRLLDSMQVIDVGGLPVVVSGVSLDKSVDGLAFVVSQALRLSEYAAMFAVFHIRGRKAQIIARARAPELDVGAVLREFGGGGHRAAAAVTVRSDDPFAVVESLRAAIYAHAPTATTVRSLMEASIQRIDASASFEEAHAMLERTGMEVLAVERDGRLVGTVDTSFTEAARRDDRLQASVASAMRHGLRSVPEELALDELAERLIAIDQPAVFVERDGEVVGWVLRRRVVEELYRVDREATWAG